MSATRFHHVTVAICATEIAVRIVVNAVSHNDNFLIAAGVIFDGIEDILPQEGASHCAIVCKVTLVIHHTRIHVIGPFLPEPFNPSAFWLDFTKGTWYTARTKNQMRINKQSLRLLHVQKNRKLHP